jgi:hypothetical protein
MAQRCLVSDYICQSLQVFAAHSRAAALGHARGVKRQAAALDDEARIKRAHISDFHTSPYGYPHYFPYEGMRTDGYQANPHHGSIGPASMVNSVSTLLRGGDRQVESQNGNQDMDLASSDDSSDTHGVV